jgi:cytidylate kinase
VAAELGYGHFSSGDFFRALGKERGLDVLQTNLRGDRNAEVDYLVDQRLREIGETEDERVIDSRTAWHWIPSSFKVFLDLDLVVGAERILANMTEERKASEHIPNDPTEYAAQLRHRLDSESRRYRALYDINPYDTANYDLVADTEVNNAEQVAKLILDGFRAWLEAQ